MFLQLFCKLFVITEVLPWFVWKMQKTCQPNNVYTFSIPSFYLVSKLMKKIFLWLIEKQQNVYTNWSVKLLELLHFLMSICSFMNYLKFLISILAHSLQIKNDNNKPSTILKNPSKPNTNSKRSNTDLKKKYRGRIRCRGGVSILCWPVSFEVWNNLTPCKA